MKTYSGITLDEINELEQIIKLRESLPHLYGFPWYRWAKDFFDDTHRAAFLCAANQVSKSSTQIRKAIDWATDQSKWKKLWPDLLNGQKPNQFWYIYPSSPVANVEWETKWVPDFLPRGQYKDDPVYGWKPVFDKGIIKQVDFNSGVTIYFKTYSQKLIDLQSGSVHAIFLDEECPQHIIPELQARIRSTNGYVQAVFTATLGQEFWRKVMEPVSKEEEIYPHAFKRTISLYDSQTYIDGTPSRWTTKRIEEIIAECTSDQEVQRRVFGRFVKSSGLKLHAFTLKDNMAMAEVIPKSYALYSGVDPGSGGKQGHPAAIVFVAVRPDYKLGYVFKAWRGDGIDTANPDILKKFRELRGPMVLTDQVYDYKDKDFYLVAASQGEPFNMANKTRDEGFGLLNSLFKNGMLKIFRGDPELDKLVGEIMTLDMDTDKREAQDDLIDALRYVCLTSIPWNFDIGVVEKNDDKYKDAPKDNRSPEKIMSEELLKSRRDFALSITRQVDDSYSDDIEYWNELSGASNDS